MSSRAWLSKSLRTRSGLMQWAMLFAAIGFVVWIVATRGDELRAAFELTPRLFTLISLSCLATFALNGIELRVLAGRFGSRIPIREALMLGLVVSTLNYLPMKTGTVLNGVVLKARYKLPLSLFTALIAGSNVIHLWVALAMAGTALLFGAEQYRGLGLLFLFGPSLFMAALMVWGSRRESGRFEQHSSRFVRVAFRAVDGVGEMLSDPLLLSKELALNIALVTLWSSRAYWAFEAIGVEASFGSVLTVTALGILFTRLSIIPGGVGFREAGAAFGSKITGLPAGAGFAASVVERAVMLLWLLVIGVPATLYMLRLAGVGLDDAMGGTKALTDTDATETTGAPDADESPTAALPESVENAPRFSLIAATVYGNRGAEAMLETAIGRVRDRFPDARFSVFSYYPEQDAQLVGDSAVTIRSSTPGYLVLVLFPLSLLAAPFARGLGKVPRIFPQAVRELGESAALIDLAGVSFIDGREKFLPFNVLTIWPAMLLGTPVFKLAQAVGPFTNALNRTAANLFLRRCRMVVPRGSTTLEHLESISFPPDKMHPAADVAFLFESRDSLSNEGAEEAEAIARQASESRAHQREVVGLCPSAVLAKKAEAEGWDYIGFMAEVASGLIEDGHTVLLFPNATRARSEKLRNNDIPVIASIVERVGDPEHLLHASGDMSAASLRVVIESCSCAAVSRFHAMVGALAIGVPVAVVGWSHKYLEVMRQFDLEEFVFDYSAHDPVALRSVINRLIAEREGRAASILESLADVLADSRSQFDELFARL